MNTYPPIVLNAYLIAFLKKERIEVSPPAAIAIFKVIHKQYESGLNGFAQLKYSITPILSRTRDEQQKIYDLLDRLDRKFEDEFQSFGPELPPVLQHADEDEGGQSLINRLKLWLRRNWIVVALSLVVIVTLLLIQNGLTKAAPSLRVMFPGSVVTAQPVQISAALADTTLHTAYRIEWLIADKKISNAWTVQTSFDSSGTYTVNAYLLKGDKRIAESINTITVNCEPLPSVIIREVSPETITTAPNRAAIQSSKTQSVTVSNRVGAKRRKSYEPVFGNVGNDSVKFQYRWYVNDLLRGNDKSLSYLKSLDENNTIRLVVALNGTHCSADSLPALFYEKQNITAVRAAGTQSLIIPSGWNAGNILSSLIFILLIPGIVAGAIYGFQTFRRRAWQRISTSAKWDKDLPHTYEFDPAEHVIHREPGMKVVADILRKRQSSLSRRVDVPATIKLSMRSWDLPQLVFEEGSKASEYLVLLDREYPDGHLTQLFAFLCRQLQSDQVNLITYDYYKQPLLLNSQTLQHELIPVERLAALYPGSILIIFGQSIQFVSSRKNTLKPWVNEKFRQWEKKIFITAYAGPDWDKKRTIASAVGFLRFACRSRGNAIAGILSF